MFDCDPPSALLAAMQERKRPLPLADLFGYCIWFMGEIQGTIVALTLKNVTPP
jgi:hypothetical protein